LLSKPKKRFWRFLAFISPVKLAVIAVQFAQTQGVIASSIILGATQRSSNHCKTIAFTTLVGLAFILLTISIARLAILDAKVCVAVN